MRKEAKRIRALVIRRFVRSVSRLKSEKGTEDALLKNQRRARSLEEIHAMKGLTLSHWCVVFRRFWTRLKNGWQMQLECPSFLQFINSPAEGHLDFFQVLAVMNKAAIKTVGRFLCGHNFSTPEGKYEAQLLDHMEFWIEDGSSAFS